MHSQVYWYEWGNKLNTRLIPTPQAEGSSSPVAPVPPSSTNAPSLSDDAYQFQIDQGNNSTNFL